MNKKILVIILCLCLVLSSVLLLCGCDENKGGTTGDITNGGGEFSGNNENANGGGNINTGDTTQGGDTSEVKATIYDENFKYTLVKPEDKLENEPVNSYSITAREDAVLSGEIVIPAEKNGVKVTRIGESAFSNNSAVTKVTIPKSIMKIEYNGFENCYGLSSVIFEEGSSLISLGERAFCNCKKLEDIVLPSSLKVIGKYSLDGCVALKSVVIPSSVVKLERNAFWGCTGLESVTFEEDSKLQYIGMMAFAQCKSLTSIFISKNVLVIGGFAFEDCTNLTINCEITEEQSKATPYVWDLEYWNYNNYPVNWGYVA